MLGSFRAWSLRHLHVLNNGQQRKITSLWTIGRAQSLLLWVWRTEKITYIFTRLWHCCNLVLETDITITMSCERAVIDHISCGFQAFLCLGVFFTISTLTGSDHFAVFDTTERRDVFRKWLLHSLTKNEFLSKNKRNWLRAEAFSEVLS